MSSNLRTFSGSGIADIECVDALLVKIVGELNSPCHLYFVNRRMHSIINLIDKHSTNRDRSC
jgi:hypothetical protein